VELAWKQAQVFEKKKGNNVPKVWLYQGKFEINFLNPPSYDLLKGS
jgi:hypothetical protein